MPEAFRVGLLGTGRMAGLAAVDRTDTFFAAHAPALRAAGGFELAGAYDPDGSRLQAFVGAWGGAPCGSPAELLERHAPAMVVIAAPDETHVSLATQVLASTHRPRLLVIEKPPCIDRPGLDALVRAADSARDTMVVVNLTRRFDAGHRVVADAVAAGLFGAPVDVLGTYYGGWLHNGIHAVDTVRMLLGADLRFVAAVPGPPGRAGDPCRDVSLDCPALPGLRVLLRGFDETAFQLFEIEVRLTEGRIRLDDFGRRIVAERVVLTPEGDRELRPSDDFRLVERCAPALTLYRACGHFLRTGEDEGLRGAGLTSVARTMELLFDAA